ncbi:MAG TPA: Asp-tRNA(Asn)/Glu-tRNA(Gln) amidotransferase subunit GatC [Planctomycetaceae bacterium]|nr:Asp-tRNA(Asn)/Glu-tRNA(Gln) amidotransferase subunit GatC [Planctomycetaceae bacterium]
MSGKLTRADVLKVATLARLKLTDAEVDDYTAKLGGILDYVASLNEIDTEDVDPMVHAVELSNVFRADEVAPSLSREAALSNAPKTDGQFFLVPQILDAQ